MALQLPNGKQQFIDSNGVPLAGGTVSFYIPATLTPKDTYQDFGATILNTNPITLDAAGEAVIFGIGAYRQILKDSLGNTVWDQLTYGSVNPFIYIGATSTGSANAQVVGGIQPTGYTLTAGNLLSFTAGFSNTGATTLNAGGTGFVAVQKRSPAGLVALSGGEIIAGTETFVIYNGTVYELVTPATNSQSEIVNPQTGASYAVVAADFGKLITRSNASAMTDTIPSGATLGSGWWCDLSNLGSSVGFVTLTPAAGTIDGLAKLILTPGQSCRIVSDGTNLQVVYNSKIAQVVNVETGSLATGTGTFTVGNTIPQNTGGNQYMSLPITPTNPNSTLLIDVFFSGGSSSGAGLTVALFQDNNANALAAANEITGSNGGTLAFRHKIDGKGTPGSVVAGTATTFKVLGGSSSGTLSFNGTGGVQWFGGVSCSSITISEILP